MNCRRCRKVISEDAVQVTRPLPPPDGRTYYLDGDCIASACVYHRKCLPPDLFHKFAGSLPAGQSPADTSLREEHVIGGGLSLPKHRKRPARRIRYKRTEARRQKESAERELRQHESTLALTIQDVLQRGGKPGLCHCRVFSSSDGYFITSNGYCRYCGCWTPEVFLAACGPERMRDTIGELDLHYRTEMLKIIAVPAS